MTTRWSKVALALGLAGSALPGCIQAPPALPEEARASVADAPAWVGRPPHTVYAAGKTRHWELRQGGQRIGHSWGRYVGPGKASGEHVFETRIELEIPGRGPVRSAGRIVLDERGRLLRGFERSNAAELEFYVEGDTLHLSSGETKDAMTYDPDRVDTAFWADTAILHEEIMLVSRDLRAGRNEWRLVSLAGGVPVEWEGTVEVAADGAVFIDTSLGERLEFRDGKLHRVHVPADDLEIRADDTVAWPQWTIEGPRRLTYAPSADASFSIREVELPGDPDDPRLWGEVLIPEGSGPHPGVLFLSGAGQQDRYGFSGPPPVDLGSHAITDALAEAGFLVLRYDERGFGRSEAGELSFSAQLDDARRAMGVLMVQEAVDPDRLAIVGHGEGGWRGLILAGERPEVQAVALLGTPGRAYEKILEHQTRQTLRDLPPEVRAEALETSRKMIQALASGKPPPPELLAQEKWLREAMKIDPGKLFRGTKARIWIAQGDKDFEVDPKVDPEALARAARSAGRKVDVVHYPTLDHLFMEEPERSAPARYLAARRPVDVSFLRDLAQWMKKMTR